MATLLKNSVTTGIGITPRTVLTTVSNNRYTIIGLNLANTGSSMVQVSIQLTDGNTYIEHAMQNVVASTGGQFTCTAESRIDVGQTVTISGTLGGSATISGYTNPKTYYIIATNGTTTFTLSATESGPAISTTAGTTDGLTFTAGTIDVTGYFLKNILVAPQSSLKAITNSEKLVLSVNNSLKISANVNNSIDAIVSYVEIL